MALKKREFTPESGTVDTYAICSQNERKNNSKYMKDETLAQDKHNMELLAVEEIQFQVGSRHTSC